MKKTIFNDASSVDKVKLRKERKSTIAFLLWFILFLGSGQSVMTAMSKYPYFNMGKLIGIMLYLLSFSCGVVGLIALKRLTKIVYKEYIEYFIMYIILILLGSVTMGIFTIVAFLSIWFHAKKLLINKEVK